MKILQTYYNFRVTSDIQSQTIFGNIGIWLILYISFNIATTILCTLLIIYRIITVSHAGMGVRSFRGIIEIIVESALIYSITLLVYLVLVACNSDKGPYLDLLAALTRVCLIHLLFCSLALMLTSLKGIAPTLIVGRVAAGHARPDESWKESITSSLHFGHHSGDQSQGTINSDVESGTGSSEEGQSSVSPADSSEQGQGVGRQENVLEQVAEVEIV